MTIVTFSWETIQRVEPAKVTLVTACKLQNLLGDQSCYLWMNGIVGSQKNKRSRPPQVSMKTRLAEARQERQASPVGPAFSVVETQAPRSGDAALAGTPWTTLRVVMGEHRSILHGLDSSQWAPVPPGAAAPPRRGPT